MESLTVVTLVAWGRYLRGSVLVLLILSKCSMAAYVTINTTIYLISRSIKSTQDVTCIFYDQYVFISPLTYSYPSSLLIIDLLKITIYPQNPDMQWVRPGSHKCG